jgi:hypothetical protein
MTNSQLRQGGKGDDDGAQYYFALPDGQTAAVTINCNWPLLFKRTGNVKLVMMLDSEHATGDMARYKTKLCLR